MPMLGQLDQRQPGEVRALHPGAGVRRAADLHAQLAAGDSHAVDDANGVEVGGDAVLGMHEVAGP